MSNKKRNLIERLNSGPVICAEGFLFEIEKRGYMASGEFVPMVSLEHPEALENLHKDFQHAGSDIVEAFTYTDRGNYITNGLIRHSYENTININEKPTLDIVSLLIKLKTLL